MPDLSIQFAFDASVPMPEVEATLRLALLAIESMHGEDRVRLETRASVDLSGRRCVIDIASEAGRTLALVFGGYVRREFGDEAVRMTRVATAGERSPVGADA